MGVSNKTGVYRGMVGCHDRPGGIPNWGSTERKQLGEGDGVEGIKGRIRCEDVEGEGKDVRWPGVYGEYPCRGEAWGRRG